MAAEQVLGGRYRIVRHLARGGMAEVYLAHDELLDRPVAVKVLFPELARDSSFVERFRREAQSAARLNHPNIVSVYDFGQHDDSFYIVMEYAAGDTLSDLIAAGSPMAPARAVAIAADVAAGLAAAHDEGIIHRDVKPANVLIDAGRVKVADFGIARAADAPGDLTKPGTVIGTSTYLSPEQARGEDIDARSDLYSLGMVIYEMLTGHRPFRGDTAIAIAYQQQHEIPAPPSAANPAVPRPLDAIVAQAMSFDRADRQRSAGQLRSELLAIDHGRVGAEPTVAFEAAATSVMPSAAAPVGAPGREPAAAAGGGGGGEPTAVAGAGGAAVSPPPPAPPAAPAAAPVTEGVYRRRRLVALALLVAVVLGAVAVVVALTSGGSATVAVPRVVGLQVADATAVLSRAGLTPAVIEQSRAGVAGQVVDQAPPAGARVRRASTVSLIVPMAVTTTITTVAPRPSTTPPSAAPTTRATSTTVAPAPSTTIVTVPPSTAPSTSAVATTAPPPPSSTVP